MLKYLLFTTIFLSVTTASFSQSKNDYDKLWEEVQRLENQGLPKSALETTERIYRKAEKEKNVGQLVKAVMHKLKFASRIEENALVKNITDMEKEIGKSEYPVTPLLHSMLAEMYWGYYMQNRWKFYNRSETVDFKNDDIETWSLEQIVAKVTKEYLASLEKAEKLQIVKIDVYDEVLIPFYSDIEKNKSRKLRPTLYDFLAHRAVDFFMNDQGQLNRPVYEFNLNHEAYLSPAQEFKSIKIETRDSTSLKFYSLIILQDLIRFHSKDSDPSALIDAELKRLNFVYANAVFASKEEKMLTTVEKEEAFYKNHPAGTEFTYEKASLIYARSQKYRPLVSDQFKLDAKRAADICREGMKRFPESDGAVNCRSLLSQIEAKSFSLQIEEVNTISNPFRVLVNFKNASKVYLRALKTSPEEIQRLEKQYNTEKYKYDYQKEMIRYFAGKKAAQTWEVALPNDGDFQQHSVEAKVPGLESGYYIVLAGSAPNLSTDNNAVAYAFTTISDISYIFRKKEKEQYEFHLLHRDKGHALKGVKARLWYQVYDDSERGYKKIDGGIFISDNEGKITIPAPKSDKREYFSLDFSLGSDRLSTGEQFYHYPYRSYPENRKYTTTYFFTDRTIYRPGQTIYFKGIMLESDGEKAEIKPKQSTTVTFYDVNHQKVTDLQLTTNEYGSFSGSFIAPTGLLNGQMYLSNSNGSVYFSVEEYKRPKFETAFLPVEGSYKLNEKITVKGNAKAYAGNNIDGAQVRYRVVRNVVLPRWCYYYGYYPTYGNNTEILNGTTVTDEKGEFKVEFDAVPDPETDPKFQPVFTYTVYADVTDLNGETRSAQTFVNAGYRALDISLGIPEELERDSLVSDNFTLNTANLNGMFEPASGTLVIHKLKTPEKAFRNRLWARPDTFVMSREEFYKNFPYDLYKDENNKYTWEKEKKVFETSFNTAKEKKFSLKNMSNAEQGVYVAEVTSKDRYGTEVKEMKYFTVYAPREKTLPYPEPSRILSIKAGGEPGEKALFTISSGFEDVRILYEIDRKNSPLQKQWLSIMKAQQLLEVPIEERDRGGFVVQFTFVKNNRFYHRRENVWVPRTDKQLDVTLETFRDKLLPGAEETWKVKIKGKKGEKTAAELLVSMYDASLDAFRSGPAWYLSPYSYYYGGASWGSQTFEKIVYSNMYDRGGWNTYYAGTGVTYDRLNNFGTYYLWGYGASYGNNRYKDKLSLRDEEDYDDGSFFGGKVAGIMAEVQAAPMASKKEVRIRGAAVEAKSGEQSTDVKNRPENSTTELPQSAPDQNSQDAASVRKNFNETAFFFPHLMTDEDGNVVFSFKMPEALTRWRFNALAHTKDVKSGGAMQTVITQKDLMVVPNAPRFFREGDELVFTAKISNLAQKALKGTARIEFFDALTMKPIDGLVIAKNIRGTSAENILSAPFSVEKEQSTQVAWNIYIPEGIQAVTYRIRAAAGNFTDGEEMTLPVLTNRMLVTESLPLPMRGMQTKTFEFKKLLEGNSGSSTLRSHKLTLEFTSNPAWYAIQALPYLMEYPYECAEQTFSRLYANSIASHIANSSPKIKNIFDAWKNKQAGSEEALLSNLEKNQELKSALLEETPWVLQAQNETERKKRIGILFDLNRMSSELSGCIKKLEKMQRGNGGWPWFEGMPDDPYITQLIVTGFGRLNRLGIDALKDNRVKNMVEKALDYCDQRIREEYEELKREAKKGYIKLEDDHLGSFEIQYLYALSYFPNHNVAASAKEAFNYFKGQEKKYWTTKGRYLQGMMAVSLHRYKDAETPAKIIRSLKETSLNSEEMGMYWKENYEGYYWYQAPIEQQALMVEVFDEVANDEKLVDDLKTWLLKEKQTNDWKTTRATADACYALLMRGSGWLAEDTSPQISLGSIKVAPKTDPDLKTEAGTGYFKTSWSGEAIKPEMGKITVRKESKGVAWGAVYWQYFEQLDKITSHETPLKLKKQLFLQKDTDRGPVLTPITDKTSLKPGDRVKVRIELRVDRNMEYVHMKDMRASCMEPEHVLSGYRYQDGLGYYESTRDAAVNFFFGYLRKGTYVFEYPLRITHEGDFSNGVTTIQCMYAPEFTSHSQGIRIRVKK